LGDKKIIEIYLKERGKKHHLTEDIPVPMTDEWEKDDVAVQSYLDSMEPQASDVVIHI